MSINSNEDTGQNTSGYFEKRPISLTKTAKLVKRKGKSGLLSTDLSY